ncbi:GNAT family N-acetyltransferase [Sapientia aquatica]|uniref:GNAT family N-acetyltransferase n=1 Tax=Sapientia aquatica TaxID=1549640 RepID=A0A4R5W268_9BURK|nr:GNAT family N-acetyltransferase [Sapientia aquatica]TDK66516.1 GNAT family N-acetyltransferase [Sapientia aquatica]
MNITLSQLDHQRFGKVTAKINIEPGQDLSQVLTWCETQQVELLIARIKTDDIYSVQNMERAGFFLTDTLVYFANNKIVASQLTLPQICSWRLATPGDAELLEKLAAKIFTNYKGHYHADQRLNKSDCDLVYSSWAANSCLNSAVADVVFLLSQSDAMIGFITVKVIDPVKRVAEIVLNGVDPDFQKHGHYSSLVSLVKNWAVENSIQQIIVSTQVTNDSVQKVWCRQGFEPSYSFYTFHKWFSA